MMRLSRASALHAALRGRLAVERRADELLSRWRRHSRPRVLATACWQFPIYSQSFVYQELASLAANGVQLRFLYSELAGKQLSPGFEAVWHGRRRHAPTVETDFADLRYFRARRPEGVENLTEAIATASGLTRGELEAHEHFRQAFGFARLVEAYDPAYLHSYFFYERTLFTLVASHLLGIPRGVSCYADHQLTDYALKVVPLHLRTCDLVVATSQRIAAELRQIEPTLDATRVIIKPNGIATDRYPRTPRRDTAASPLRIVSISRLAEKKGLLYLIDAVAELQRRGSDVELLVGGEVEPPAAASPSYADALAARIRERNVERRVRMAGRLDYAGVLKALAWADVFAAPYIETRDGDKDGIPTAVLEAMATGLGVVATDAGSICEVVRDGESALVVPQRDPEALADALARLGRDGVLRARLGDAAARSVRERFDVSRSEPLFHERVRELSASRSVAKATIPQ